MNVIKIEDLHFSYGEEELLRGVDFELEKGDLALLLGENGSGKSTLLKIIIGSLKKDLGKVFLFGERIEDFSSWNYIAYQAQFNDKSIPDFPLTVYEYVLTGLYSDFNFFNIPKKEDRERAYEILNNVSLYEKKDELIKNLSGGQMQRVSIARVMIKEPRLILFDEPTAGLDLENKRVLYRLIGDIRENYSTTVLMVTHENAEEIAADGIYRLEGGRIRKC